MAEKLFFFCSFFKCLVFSPKRHFFFFDEKQKKREKKKKKRSWFCRDTYVMSFMSSGVIYGTPSGLTTIEIEIKKRRIGERDSLWGLMVKNDDISFIHILPRLKATDIKFLYGVNSETRKLIKRSSRAGDLVKRFKVNGMSSISTLEFAWEHKSLWPSWWDEHISAFKLLERINSSCSSGCERRNSVSGM